MINVLEIDMSIDYKFSWNIAARACFQLYHQLDDCMLIYKYKLADIYIWSKFGCSHPGRIDLTKLDGKNLFLIHLDVYKEDTCKLKELIDYCQSNDIDIWIGLSGGIIWREEYPHIKQIRDILEKYEHNLFDLKGMNYKSESEINTIIKSRLQPIIRGVKLRKLLD